MPSFWEISIDYDNAISDYDQSHFWLSKNEINLFWIFLVCKTWIHHFWAILTYKTKTFLRSFGLQNVEFIFFKSFFSFQNKNEQFRKSWCFWRDVLGKRDVFGVMFWKKTWCFQRDVLEKTWCFSYDILKKNWYFSVMFWKKKDIFDTLFKRIREGLRWKSWCFIMESKKLFHPLNYIFYHQL